MIAERWQAKEFARARESDWAGTGGGVEKLAHGMRGRAEGWLGWDAAGVVGSAVRRGVNADDLEGELAAFAGDQRGQGFGYAEVTDEGESHPISLAGAG